MKPKLPPFFIMLVALLCTLLVHDSLQASDKQKMPDYLRVSCHMETKKPQDMFAMAQTMHEVAQLMLAGYYLASGDWCACRTTLEGLPKTENWYAVFMRETFNWVRKDIYDNRMFIDACILLLRDRPKQAVGVMGGFLLECSATRDTLAILSALSEVMMGWEKTGEVGSFSRVVSRWMREVRLSSCDDAYEPIVPDGACGCGGISLIDPYGDSATWHSVANRDGKTPGTAIRVRS